MKYKGVTGFFASRYPWLIYLIVKESSVQASFRIVIIQYIILIFLPYVLKILENKLTRNNFKKIVLFMKYSPYFKNVTDFFHFSYFPTNFHLIIKKKYFFAV